MMRNRSGWSSWLSGTTILIIVLAAIAAWIGWARFSLVPDLQKQAAEKLIAEKEAAQEAEANRLAEMEAYWLAQGVSRAPDEGCNWEVWQNEDLGLEMMTQNCFDGRELVASVSGQSVYETNKLLGMSREQQMTAANLRLTIVEDASASAGRRVELATVTETTKPYLIDVESIKLKSLIEMAAEAEARAASASASKNASASGKVQTTNAGN